jgi:hypothetical protein
LFLQRMLWRARRQEFEAPRHDVRIPAEMNGPCEACPRTGTLPRWLPA